MQRSDAVNKYEISSAVAARKPGLTGDRITAPHRTVNIRRIFINRPPQYCDNNDLS